MGITRNNLTREPMTRTEPAKAPTKHGRKITVVFLIDLLLKSGGTENQLKTLIRGLDRTRFRPLLVTSRPGSVSYFEDVACPVYNLDIRSLFSFGMIRGVWKLCRLLKKEQVDILQMFFIDSNIIGVIAAKLAGTKRLIISRRDLGLWYHWKHLKATNFLNRYTHYCIANAEAIKQVVDENETLKNDRIKVIFNGMDIAKTDQAEPIESSEIGVPENAPVVGIVANLRTVKRIDRFIEMATKIKNPDAHFVIVGEGYMEQDLKRMAAESSIPDRIHFYYTTTRTMSVMKRLRVGVLTSESEGLSNVLIEYALNGVPAISFDTGGNAEVINDDETGYIVPAYDIDLLAEKVDYLLAHSDRAKEMGKLAASRARELFSVNQMVAETEEFYINILSETVD